jgi:hypothetical protein
MRLQLSPRLLGTWIQEALGDAASSRGTGAGPGAEDAAPLVLALAEALDLAVRVSVVVGEASLGVAVLGWVVGDDAQRRGRWFY